jgi:hypothetical protein
MKEIAAALIAVASFVTLQVAARELAQLQVHLTPRPSCPDMPTLWIVCAENACPVHRWQGRATLALGGRPYCRGSAHHLHKVVALFINSTLRLGHTLCRLSPFTGGRCAANVMTLASGTQPMHFW